MEEQARIDAKMNTVTNGAEESRLDLQVQVGGTLGTVASVFSHASKGKGIELVNDGQLGSVGYPKAVKISSSGVVSLEAHDGASAGLQLGATLVTATGAELNYLDVTTLGTSEASKALTADASGHVTIKDGAFDFDIASHDGTNGLKLGGALVRSSAAEMNLLLGASVGSVVNSKAVVYSAAGKVAVTALSIGGADVTATAAEINL